MIGLWLSRWCVVTRKWCACFYKVLTGVVDIRLRYCCDHNTRRRAWRRQAHLGRTVNRCLYDLQSKGISSNWVRLVSNVRPSYYIPTRMSMRVAFRLRSCPSCYSIAEYSKGARNGSISDSASRFSYASATRYRFGSSWPSSASLYLSFGLNSWVPKDNASISIPPSWS